MLWWPHFHFKHHSTLGQAGAGSREGPWWPRGLLLLLPRLLLLDFITTPAGGWL
jgi:hypothetical protein